MCNPGNASESYLDLDLPHNLASPEVRPDGLTYVWSDSEKPNVSGERSHSPAYHVPIPLAGQLFWGTEFSCFFCSYPSMAGRERRCMYNWDLTYSFLFPKPGSSQVSAKKS